MIERMKNNPVFKKLEIQQKQEGKSASLDDYDDEYFKQWILTSEHNKRWENLGESGL